MNFLKSININQKKNIKLYAEADTNPELPDLSFEEPEVPEEPDEPEVVEEPNTEEALDDMENLDFDGDGDSDTGEVTEEFDTEDPTLNEEIEDFDDSALGFMGEEENMFNNGEDENTSAYHIKDQFHDYPWINTDDSCQRISNSNPNNSNKRIMEYAAGSSHDIMCNTADHRTKNKDKDNIKNHISTSCHYKTISKMKNDVE